MRHFLLITILAFTIVGCEDNDIAKDTPSCIGDIINGIKAGGVWNPPAKVFSYTYNGKTVYYVPSRCCDIPSQLWDENCNLICNPDGGFSGGGDGKCPDFFKERSNEKLIWEDDRK